MARSHGPTGGTTRVYRGGIRVPAYSLNWAAMASYRSARATSEVESAGPRQDKPKAIVYPSPFLSSCSEVSRDRCPESLTWAIHDQRTQDTVYPWVLRNLDNHDLVTSLQTVLLLPHRPICSERRKGGSRGSHPCCRHPPSDDRAAPCRRRAIGSLVDRLREGGDWVGWVVPGGYRDGDGSSSSPSRPRWSSSFYAARRATSYAGSRHASIA